MYCRKCYAKLDDFVAMHQCPQCLRYFDPADSRSYLARPFPSVDKIVVYVAVTSLISVGVAFVVASFQLAGASGH